MITAFDFACTPQVYFGAGKLSMIPSLLTHYGKKILLVRGKSSFDSSSLCQELLRSLDGQGLSIQQFEVAKEPTPYMIDQAVAQSAAFRPDVVLGIGGGSVLDSAKAISAMILIGQPVKDFLEGVGTKAHPGIKVPFVAVPTTSGTGSEATKNSVLSEVGENGYKKSLRHNRFVPDVAVIDPRLTVSCPPDVTAASGMDAFTQLLESFLSTTSNPMTEAWSIKGLELVSRSLLKVYQNPSDLSARTDMSLAAYLSGVCLANAGLGLVHGFASSIGGFYEIPHGVICSSIMASSNIFTVRKLREQNNVSALAKYAAVGKLFFAKASQTDEYAVDALLDYISRMTLEMRIPGLSTVGVSPADARKISLLTDNKNNPAILEPEERMEVFQASL
jgi:alcohol dehydrogenase class IV